MYVRIPTLQRMNFLATEFIFDRKKMSDIRKTELLEGIDQWRRRKNVPGDQMREINLIIGALADDAKGKFLKIKETLEKHKLDYRMVFKDGI